MENYYSTVIKSKKYDPLTPDEEKELSRQIRENDHQHEARNRLVCGSLRFAVLVANQYQGAGVPVEELIQEANKGLIEAASSFDGRKNFKFVSYSVWWIRKNILMAISRYSRIVRVPPNSAHLSLQIQRAISKLQQVYQREPTSEEIARHLGIKKSWVEVLEKTNHQVSLNTETDTGSELLDTLTYDEHESNIDETLVRKTVKGLPSRERNYVKRFYFGECKIRLEDIGIKDGLSGERVRQIISKGECILKKRIRKSEVYA